MPEALIVIAYLTVRAGKRLEFEEFERQALSLVRQHGGELLHALEPIATSPSTDPPDEVHILRFPSQRALHDYRADPALLSLAALRTEAIADTKLLIATPLAWLPRIVACPASPERPLTAVRYT